MKSVGAALAATIFLIAGSSASDSAWEITRNISPMTDMETIQVMALASRVVEGDDLPGIALIISCTANKTDMGLVSLTSYFGHFADRSFMYRVDDKPAQTTSAIGHETVLSVRPKAVSTLKQIIGGTTLLIEAVPSGSRFIAEFDLAGFDDAIRPLRDACNW